MIKKERREDMKSFQDLFNRTSIIAPKRDARPFINEEDLSCPFCLANRGCLESIIDESWQDGELLVRIVRNRYPITSEFGVKGQHDVIIDTQYHKMHPKDFSYVHWEMLLFMIQKRWNQIMEDSKIKFIQVFKNYGIKAGASISHSHWQVIALEEIPYSMKEKYLAYYEEANCYLCDVQHQRDGFLVWEDAHIEVWVPSIPQYPYEVWLIPKCHRQHYGELSSWEIKTLGKLIKYFLEIYHQLNSQGDFNICMMSGDVKGEYPYHFYIQLVMRIGHIAGFEIATSCHILSVEPRTYVEEMKKFLKGMYK